MAVQQAVEAKVYRAKVCLVGEFAVGKTSLVNRYVRNIFHDRYFATIGAKITKAEVTQGGEDSSQVIMTIWDIMGEKGFRELLKEAYFDGTNGALAVCDLTRSDTLDETEAWISAIFRIAGRIPIVIVGNKTDLEDRIKIHEDDIAAFAKRHSCPYVITSAKSGENVQAAFKAISKLIAEGR
ncbi:MAG: Rab family GTPase [Thermoplasmata archaeon]